MTEFTNYGIALACALICLWPFAFHLIMLALSKRIRTYGWRSLLPPYTKTARIEK